MGSPINDPAQILRASSAPPAPGLWIDPASPTYRDPVTGMVLTPYPVVYNTHWIDKIKGPHKICTIETGECSWHHLELRWTCAIVIKLSRGGGIRLVRLSANAARSCESGHFRDPPKATRGWGMTWSRIPGGRNGRQVVELSWRDGLIDSLPPGPDLPAYLMHLYGADRLPCAAGGVQ